MGLLETAAATLIGGESRVATAARNVTNLNTPGYKREVSYTELTQPNNRTEQALTPPPTVRSMVLSTQGVLMQSDNPLDLALNGSGMMLLRDGEQYFLSRGGQFAMGADGTLIDALGRIVQQAGGGDLQLTSANAEILADGTVLEDNVPGGTIALFDGDDLDAAAALTLEQLGDLSEAEDTEIQQGMIERSNVALSDEMVTLMRSQRQVESGAQLVRAYDQLMSQAISTFSRSR